MEGNEWKAVTAAEAREALRVLKDYFEGVGGVVALRVGGELDFIESAIEDG